MAFIFCYIFVFLFRGWWGFFLDIMVVLFWFFNFREVFYSWGVIFFFYYWLCLRSIMILFCGFNKLVIVFKLGFRLWVRLRFLSRRDIDRLIGRRVWKR